jgi:putative ABC transport system permease protein
MGSRSRVWNALATWGELGWDALREIRGHKLRSLLTLFGIVFGAAAVVAMTSLAAGVKYMAYKELREMDMVATFQLRDRGPRSDAVRAADLRHPGLKLADVEALRRLRGVETAYGRNFAGRQLVSTTLDQRLVPVSGIDAGYLTFRNWPVVRGREFAALDIINAQRVAVIGEELVEPFFGNTDPVGRTIKVDGIEFRVIGVVAPIEFELIPANFSFLARRVYLPYTYITVYHMGGQRVDNVLLKVSEDADFPSVMRAGEVLLRQRHLGAEDFEVENEAAEVLESLAMADDILGGWNVVLYTIAGVTLIVGGIGLFSVLLISVRERVREIGIRKALGADDWDIRRLFLVESVTLALLGATLGVAGGVGLILVTKAVARQFGSDFFIPLHIPGVAMAISFALLVGLVFGWYPAKRASRLDPIEAIREL